jgi:hypothetical protein
MFTMIMSFIFVGMHARTTSLMLADVIEVYNWLEHQLMDNDIWMLLSGS